MIFVEYVPTDGVSDHLALSADEAAGMVADVEHARELFDDMIILAFPGDEAAMGGCLASGRGFFHINPQGGAEPCPFSPFSEHSVRTDSLREILDSQFFDGTRHIALNAGSHVGGCVLFERDEEVRALLA